MKTSLIECGERLARLLCEVQECGIYYTWCLMTDPQGERVLARWQAAFAQRA